MKYRIVEKANHLAVHALFDTIERAENHLSEILPLYVERGYLMNKSLKVSDFIIQEVKK